MRFTPACLNVRNVGRRYLSAHVSRAASVSFLGLGRMGSEMAFNLFSKRHALASEECFVVCDAVPEAASAFAANLRHNFPASKIRIVGTPEE